MGRVAAASFDIWSWWKRCEGLAAEARRERERLRRRGALALPVWLQCTAAAWEETRRRGGATGMRALEAAYDTALWVLLLLLVHRTFRCVLVQECNQIRQPVGHFVW